MATKYLSKDGLIYFWSLVKNHVSGVKSELEESIATKADTSSLSTVATSGKYTDLSDITTLSVGTTTGTGNAISAITVSDHTINITKNSTFLTSSDISGKADKATTASGYGITDVYTKSEIDTKLTSAMTYKGSVNTYADLPTSGNKVGDFYNITATGNNYAWTGTEWDETGIVDLSAYLKASDVADITNSEIDTIVA